MVQGGVNLRGDVDGAVHMFAEIHERHGRAIVEKLPVAQHRPTASTRNRLGRRTDAVTLLLSWMVRPESSNTSSVISAWTENCWSPCR